MEVKFSSWVPDKYHSKGMTEVLHRAGTCNYERQEISLKKIYDEVTEGIFDMSNVIIFIKKLKRKKWGMFILCYDFIQLSAVKRLA